MLFYYFENEGKKEKKTKRRIDGAISCCFMTATHPSPNHARRCLTYEIGHKCLFSTRYGRCWVKCVLNVYISFIIFLVYFLTRARTALLRYYQRSLHIYHIEGSLYCTSIYIYSAFCSARNPVQLASPWGQPLLYIYVSSARSPVKLASPWAWPLLYI